MKIPKITWTKTKHWNGAFALFRAADRSIEIYEYPWVPKWFYRRFVIPHELGHYYGVPASGCLGKHLWCVMAEESQVGFTDGTFFGKLLLAPFQLLYGWGRYCKKCEQRIEENNGCPSSGGYTRIPSF